MHDDIRTLKWLVRSMILVALLLGVVIGFVAGVNVQSAQGQGQYGVQMLTSGVSSSAVPMAVFDELGAAQAYGDQELAAGRGDIAYIYETYGGDVSIVNKPLRWVKTSVDFTYGGQFRQWTRVGG